MLNEAVKRAYDFVVEDVNNNIAGGDKLLVAADVCNAEIGKLLDKMGLKYNLREMLMARRRQLGVRRKTPLSWTTMILRK